METSERLLSFLTLATLFLLTVHGFVPIVLTTWSYPEAVAAGWQHAISDKPTASLDAVEATGSTCEFLQCRHTVGFGGSPGENGETTLDAMIMDGVTHNVGAVGDLRRIKNAIGVARKVLDNTDHTLLVGDSATDFAKRMGFTEESLTTNYSTGLWKQWKAANCQPNFWKNVTPDPSMSCGPYSPIPPNKINRCGSEGHMKDIGIDNHDTIGIMVIDKFGNVAAGTSTNGLTYKIPGRVGDSPVMGAGAYADTDIGAAACTGNGDIMMRFLPSYQTVALMSTGMTPDRAAAQAIDTIRRKYPDFKGAVVAVNKDGKYGASCHSWTNFAITVRDAFMPDVKVFNVTCH